MNNDSIENQSLPPEPAIVDSNGIAARPEQIPDLILPGEENPNDEQAAAEPENVVEMPPQQLERTAKIKVSGNRRAIELLFETYLDGPRVNLLLARIYVAAENAEREVNRLEIKDVKRILEQFKEARPARTDGEAG